MVQDGIKHMVKRCEEASASNDVVMEQRPVLPFDIVADILSRLSVETLLTFRCVCKQWCSLIHDPGFVNEQHNKAFDRPMAMLSLSSFNEMITLYHFRDDGKGMKESSFCGDFGGRFHYTLSNAVNGLVCVYCHTKSDDGDIYLLNPSTRQVAKLPRSRVCGTCVGLAFDVSTGKYKVVRVCRKQGDEQYYCGCEVLTVGSGAWRYVGDVKCRLPRRQPYFVSGALHWVTCKYPGAYGPDSMTPSVLVFDVKEEKFWLMPPPNHTHAFSMYCIYLGMLGGHLCFVKRPNPSIRHIKGASALLKIWVLTDYEHHNWGEEYTVDVSSFGGRAFRLDVVGIKGQEILLQVEQERKRRVICPRHRNWVLYSFDIGSRTIQHLCDQAAPSLTLFTESLVSVRELIS